eukprot:CAMPEP_0182435084 /NCGR_PEP_ID=MMETSP1167-20130531/73596_1 /TAXON_ID=2988 /ORGANISM="Mallomonas Sp, Strain CCMP3275" /LENGTH=921 /DNA_ID=CAMNT_0024625717 /DNA_START=57 /DNA_END=2822 /DNA_ORIENTATION=+
MAEQDDDIEKIPAGKGGGEDFENDLEANTSAFEALERDFQEVLTELMGDTSLEKFRLEYEKLHRALKKSHEQEKRLVKKCRELNSEILNNQAKIKTALRLSQEDQKTISHLQKEMEKTWKLVYMSQEKEMRAKETISQLKDEMANLSKLVERGAGLSLNQENMVKELRLGKDELQRQVEELQSQLTATDKQLTEQHKQYEELRDERDSASTLIDEYKGQISLKEGEILREQRRREKTQKELQDARIRLDEKQKLESQMSEEVSRTQGQMNELERQLNDARATMEKYLRDYDTLFHRTQKVTEDLEEQVVRNRQLQTLNAGQDKELKLKVAEIHRLSSEKDTIERKLEREHHAALAYKQQVEDAKTPLAVSQAEVDSLQKELLDHRKREEKLEKRLNTIERDKTIQIHATQRAESKTKEQEDMVKEQERVTENMSAELNQYKSEVQRLRKVVYQLEKDRERLGNEVGEQRNQYLNVQDEMKLREVRINELQKKVSDWEAKLKQQQQLYESVRSDRNHYSKHLIESQDEIAEMRKKFKIMDHQIEQLKEEIGAKDQALVKEHFDFQRAEKLREHKQNELSRNAQLLKNNQELIQQQDVEIRRLASTIRRMDEESLSQRKEYDQVINERDILGTQLIRRNDELALLYEKLRVQTSVIKAGEAQYARKMEDLVMMKVKMSDLQRQLSVSSGSGIQVEEQRRQILQLQKELLQEKTKVTALSEELENPMNVHRWRKLEGSDPATFELIQKIQTLQRRLIAKTEEVVEKGLIIQEKDKLYSELKAILARQPGPEVAEQMTILQQTLKGKARQMKAMASELNMYQAQVNEFKYDNERTNRELQDMKRKYFQQKRKGEMLKEIGDIRGGGGGGEKGGNAMAATDMPGVRTDESNGVIMSKSAPYVLQNEQAANARQARTRYAGGGYAIK